MTKIQEIILRYKGEQTWEEMADYINQTPKLQSPISRATVNMWGLGKSKPDYYFLLHLHAKSTGWVVRMAEDVLKVIAPEK